MGVKTVLTCDVKGCTATKEFAAPYHVVKDAMKQAGWRNVKVGESWEIRCPACQGK